MEKNAFQQQLIALRDHYHTKNHPFFALWEEGKLNKRQMGYYLVQHSHMTEDGLRAYGLCYVKAPPEVQTPVIDNLAEEMGLKGIRANAEAANHRNLLSLWTRECGYSDEEVAGIEPVAGALAVRHCWMHLAYHYDWPVFLAAMTVIESQEVGIQSRIVPALHTHYGYAAGDPRIHFFEEHYEADQIHGARNFLYLGRYVKDPAMQALCLRHAEAICKLRWLYMNEIHRHAVLGQAEPMPPRWKGPAEDRKAAA